MRTPKRSAGFVVRRVCVSMTIAAVMSCVLAAHAQDLGSGQPPREREQERDRSDGNRPENAPRRQSPDAAKRAELKKRFEARADRLNRWKTQGLIGETFEGWVEAVHDDLIKGEQREVVADENADRKALYALIAERVDESGESRHVPPRAVADRNARRNFDKAESAHLLKVSEGYWISKRDLPQADEVTRLKKVGEIGETWEGFLNIVDGGAGDAAKSLIQQMNAARQGIYRDIARRLDKTSPEEVGRSVGKSTREHLPVGHSYQTKDGDWEERQAK